MSWRIGIYEGALAANEDDTLLTREGEALLAKFADVFLEDLPLDLPPNRSIQIQINLILAATILNRPLHRMSLE